MKKIFLLLLIMAMAIPIFAQPDSAFISKIPQEYFNFMDSVEYINNVRSDSYDEIETTKKNLVKGYDKLNYIDLEHYDTLHNNFVYDTLIFNGDTNIYKSNLSPSRILKSETRNIDIFDTESSQVIALNNGKLYQYTLYSENYQLEEVEIDFNISNGTIINIYNPDGYYSINDADLDVELKINLPQSNIYNIEIFVPDSNDTKQQSVNLKSLQIDVASSLDIESYGTNPWLKFCYDPFMHFQEAQYRRQPYFFQENQLFQQRIPKQPLETGFDKFGYPIYLRYPYPKMYELLKSQFSRDEQLIFMTDQKSWRYGILDGGVFGADISSDMTSLANCWITENEGKHVPHNPIVFNKKMMKAYGALVIVRVDYSNKPTADYVGVAIDVKDGDEPYVYVLCYDFLSNSGITSVEILGGSSGKHYVYEQGIMPWVWNAPLPTGTYYSPDSYLNYASLEDDIIGIKIPSFVVTNTANVNFKLPSLYYTPKGCSAGMLDTWHNIDSYPGIESLSHPTFYKGDILNGKLGFEWSHMDWWWEDKSIYCNPTIFEIFKNAGYGKFFQNEWSTDFWTVDNSRDNCPVFNNEGELVGFGRWPLMIYGQDHMTVHLWGWMGINNPFMSTDQGSVFDHTLANILEEDVWEYEYDYQYDDEEIDTDSDNINLIIPGDYGDGSEISPTMHPSDLNNSGNYLKSISEPRNRKTWIREGKTYETNFIEDIPLTKEINPEINLHDESFSAIDLSNSLEKINFILYNPSTDGDFSINLYPTSDYFYDQDDETYLGGYDIDTYGKWYEYKMYSYRDGGEYVHGYGGKPLNERVWAGTEDAAYNLRSGSLAWPYEYIFDRGYRSFHNFSYVILSHNLYEISDNIAEVNTFIKEVVGNKTKYKLNDLSTLGSGDFTYLKSSNIMFSKDIEEVPFYHNVDILDGDNTLSKYNGPALFLEYNKPSKWKGPENIEDIHGFTKDDLYRMIQVSTADYNYFMLKEPLQTIFLANRHSSSLITDADKGRRQSLDDPTLPVLKLRYPSISGLKLNIDIKPELYNKQLLFLYGFMDLRGEVFYVINTTEEELNLTGDINRSYFHTEEINISSANIDGALILSEKEILIAGESLIENVVLKIEDIEDIRNK